MYVNNIVLKIIDLVENSIEVKHPGAFKEWCKKNGFKEVNCKCICAALKTDDKTLHKRAIFANNFGKHNCKCVKNHKKSK